MFDDETAAVKNEVGGGNLSVLERHPARGRQGGTKCDAEGLLCATMVELMQFLLRCIRQTGGRINKKKNYRQRGEGRFSICRIPHKASAFLL